MISTRWCAMACALCLGPAALGSIVNGGFEPVAGGPTYVALPGGSTQISGWTTTDSGAEWFQPSAFGLTNSPNGGWVVDVANTVFSAGGIEQTFTTVASTVYQVDFHFGSHQASGRDGTAEIIVAAGAASQTFNIANPGSDIVWEARSFTFTANAASTTLSFRCVQSAFEHFAYIDGITATVVPAPAIAASMIIAGIGALGRRKR